MSAQATAWAWDQDVRQNVKLLLLLLADSADRYGHGPKEAIDDAPGACGLDNQTVRKHLRQLESLGLLKVGPDDRYILPQVPPPKRGAFRFREQE